MSDFLPRRGSSPSPIHLTSPHLYDNNHLPSTTSLASSSSAHRQNSQSSHRSGLVPSPRLPPLPPSAPMSSGSSASGSRSGSYISTPKLLSRRSSAKEREKPAHLVRNGSVKGKGKEEDTPRGSTFQKADIYEGWRSPILSESGSAEVIETPLLRLERDPETGRKMINQYLVGDDSMLNANGQVLQEIGYGTHGRVRLGRDMSVEPSGEEEGLEAAGVYYKRLTGFSRQKGMLAKGAKTDGGKLMNESEIRKEIAIFKKVNHPNVVRMKEIIDDPDSSKLFMVLEYCEGGEIHWKNDDGTPALTVAETRGIFRDTLLGLEYPLRVASALGGPDGDEYVDDVELAKTAGSPAFFAPEMCYSGLDHEILPRNVSPSGSPTRDPPAFTIRPPSVRNDSTSDPYVTSPGGRTFPLKPTSSNDSSHSRRPGSVRTHSSSTILRKERLPITNAIDVWALGVTLYCLLFGKTPFDAPNEYLLMQVIPVTDFEIPPTMGQDQMVTGESAEALECVDLLNGLLTKDPSRRIPIEMAKVSISDPSSWLASTDPHARDFVTVSNDEVAQVVTTSSSFKDKFRKGIKSISSKLQIFGNTRNRSRSIGDTDSVVNSVISSNAPSTAPSQVNLLYRPSPIVKPSRTASGRDISPVPSPMPGMTRRFSLLAGSKQDFRAPSPIRTLHPSPRRSTIQLASPDATASPEALGRSVSAQSGTSNRGFIVHRRLDNHLLPPTSSSSTSTVNPTMVPVSDTSQSPRHVASATSLDKLRSDPALSPTNSLRRRQSDDISGSSRQRSTSNASSSHHGIGSKLVRLLSRNSSQRSRINVTKKPSLAGSDLDDDAQLPRQSLESTIESGSYSSNGGNRLMPSPDRLGNFAWDSRLRNEGRVRRSSNLSERPVNMLDNDIDYDISLSALSDDDDDEYDDQSPGLCLPRSAPNFPPSWHGDEEGLGLDFDSSPPSQGAHHVSAVPALDPIPDASPTYHQSVPRPLNLSPTHGEFGFRSHSKGSPSPFRPGSAMSEKRTRSPLGFKESLYSDDARKDDDEDDDGGLAISLGRRGRKGSLLANAPKIISEET
ncbi:SNF1-activating kinase 1, partial [Tremellales sp. Uapishka_1]